MYRTFRNLFIISLVLFCTSLSAQIRDYVPVVRPVYHPETVAFLNRLSDSMKQEGYNQAAEILKSYASGGFGSGFVIVAPDGRNYVVTNRHVVSQAVSVTLEFDKADDSQVVFKNCPVLAVDEGLDLAVVALPNDARPFKAGLSFAGGAVEDGLEVWSAGYPGLGSTPSWQLGKGNVTNGRARIPQLADPSITTLIQHSAQVDPGNSGGPLLVADKSVAAGFKVVGINTWKAEDRQATNFSIPSAAISSFIDRALVVGKEAKPQSQLLEARCRDFIGSFAKTEDAYKALARFISYQYVAQSGEAMLKDALGTAPTRVRNDIIDVFSNVSPIEGIRLAIAYHIDSLVTKGGASASLSFVAIEGNPDAADTPVPVRFSLGSNAIDLSWMREHGVWRLVAYPEATAQSSSTKGGPKMTGTSAMTIESPYSLMVQGGPDLALSSKDSTFWDFGAVIVPDAYIGFGARVGFASISTTDSFGSSSSGFAARLGALVRAQLPLRFVSFTLIPYVDLTGGMMLDMAADSESDSGIFATAEGGVAVGIGENPNVFVGAAYKTYLSSPSGGAAPAIAIWLGLGL